MAQVLSKVRAGLLGAAGAAGLLAAPCAAMAQATTNFNVTATVLAACSVTATDLDFGDYTASAVSADTATSTISVTCTDGEGYTVALDAGDGDGATVDGRLLTSVAEDTLSYGLYTDGTYLSIWGDGSNSTVTVPGTGDGTEQDLTVFGRIATAQYVPAGAYSDSILVTVSF